MKLIINKLTFKKHSLLALLVFNAPAWSMDHANMNMSSMSGMDTNKEIHTRSSKPKAKHHHAEKPKPVIKETAPNAVEMSNMDHAAMPMNHDMDMSNMDHSTMDINDSVPMQNMDHGNMQVGTAEPMQNMDHHDMSAMPMSMHMGSMQGGTAPANARNSDYSQGRDFGPIHPPMMMGNDPLMSLAVNRLELGHNGDNNQGAYEIEGWWGDDWNRAVLKAEGEISNQSLSDARTELLWRKPISTFWNTELGVRQDSGYANNRTWAGFGINGISPYWVSLDATLYIRDQSQTELILTSEYDWRITQRLILQPRVEMSLYGKNDLTNDIGEGLSEVQSGLRLRYEISRQFAPYIGIENNRHYGKTADLMKASNEQPNQTFAVVGVALWF